MRTSVPLAVLSAVAVGLTPVVQYGWIVLFDRLGVCGFAWAVVVLLIAPAATVALIPGIVTYETSGRRTAVGVGGVVFAVGLVVSLWMVDLPPL